MRDADGGGARALARIAESGPYWKRHSKAWLALEIAALVAALAENIFVPTVEEVDNLPYRAVLGAGIAAVLILAAVSLRSERARAKLFHYAQYVFAVGVVLIVWDLATQKVAILPLPFFPSLGQILQVIVEDWEKLLVSTLYSLRLLAVGFAVGTVSGLATGVFLGWYRQVGYWVFPTVKIMSVIPATAWIPIAMILFPSSFGAEVFLIVLAVWSPVAFMTATGIAGVPKAHIEAALTLGADERFLLFRVAVPGAMPSIFIGIYTATGLSFATLVISEMLGAKAGLGWYINWAKSWSNYAAVYASIVIMAILFSIVMGLVFRLRDRALVWQKGLLK
jgi:NitT/TauT family transport system permease protein